MSSSTFETSKILAAVGALLTFLGFTPVLGVVGLILLVIGLKGLSEHYRDPSIYQNAFKGLIFGIIGFIILSIATASWGVLGALTFGPLGLAGVIGTIIGAIVLLVIGFIFFLLMAINFRKVLFALGERSGDQMFFTAGKWLYLGAILSIILVGYILIFIAWILATTAFFQLKPSGSQPAYSYTPPPTAQPPPAAPTANTGTQYCPHCGASVSQGAAFCSHCGKQI